MNGWMDGWRGCMELGMAIEWMELVLLVLSRWMSCARRLLCWCTTGRSKRRRIRVYSVVRVCCKAWCRCFRIWRIRRGECACSGSVCPYLRWLDLVDSLARSRRSLVGVRVCSFRRKSMRICWFLFCARCWICPRSRSSSRCWSKKRFSVKLSSRSKRCARSSRRSTPSELA